MFWMKIMSDTIFSKIIDGEIPCDKVYEDEEFIAFKDIKPMAPVHILIIPKRRDIASLQSIPPSDMNILAGVGRIAQKLAVDFGIEDSGYRLVTNVGPDSRREVEHLHFHLIGGRYLGSIG